MREFTMKAQDGLMISAALLEAENPKAVVQIIHGAKEHKERYYDFMRFLNENGYAVIISDNRGHGASVNETYSLGYMHGTDDIIRDQRLVTEYVRQMYPGKPFYLFGHSFGTLLAREYIQKYDADVEKLVLSGTVNHMAAAAPGCMIGRMITKIKGEKGESKFLQSFLDGKDNSWVVSDAGMLEKYRKDPLCCGYMYTNGALMTIFESVTRLKKYHLYGCQNPKLPILLISGEEDPITGGKKGLADTMATLKKIGYDDIRNIVYPGMKHEVLNETGHRKVYEDVVAFLVDLLQKKAISLLTNRLKSDKMTLVLRCGAAQACEYRSEEDCRKAAKARRRNNALRYFECEMGLQLDDALENLRKGVPKVKAENRESLRQKDSEIFYR